MSQKGSLPPSLLAHLSSRSRDLSGVRVARDDAEHPYSQCFRSLLEIWFGGPLDKKGIGDLWPRQQIRSLRNPLHSQWFPLLQYHSESTVDITGLSGHWPLA